MVGSVMADLITYVTRIPELGETLDAPSFALAPGGKGANQAVAAALLGSRVTMVACVGDDAFGTAALHNFRARGIDASHVRVVAGTASGVAPIFVDPTGENRILIVRGANDALEPRDVVAAEAAIADCEVLVLQLEVPLETVYAALELGARHGRRVVLSPAPAAPELDLERLRGLTYLVPNQSELALLSEQSVETPEDALSAAQALVSHGVACVVATLGPAGVLVVDGQSSRHVPGVRVGAIDTTGAGDAFVGSFVHHLAAGDDLERALDGAVWYAADSVTKRGTQTSFATRAEFDAFRKVYDRRPQS